LLITYYYNYLDKLSRFYIRRFHYYYYYYCHVKYCFPTSIPKLIIKYFLLSADDSLYRYYIQQYSCSHQNWNYNFRRVILHVIIHGHHSAVAFVVMNVVAWIFTTSIKVILKLVFLCVQVIWMFKCAMNEFPFLNKYSLFCILLLLGVSTLGCLIRKKNVIHNITQYDEKFLRNTIFTMMNIWIIWYLTYWVS